MNCKKNLTNENTYKIYEGQEYRCYSCGELNTLPRNLSPAPITQEEYECLYKAFRELFKRKRR
jgi:hypothetical protein